MPTTHRLYRGWVSMIERMRVAKHRGAAVFVFDASEENCIPGLHRWYRAEQPAAVFRQYYCPDIDYQGPPPVFTLPLGVHPKHTGGWDAAMVPPLASTRPQVLAYLGSMTHTSRRNLARLVSEVSRLQAEAGDASATMGHHTARGSTPHASGGLAKGRPVEGAAYQAVLWNATFCPVPRGHAVETFRLNEALEAGCIAVIDAPEHLEHSWPGISEHAIVSNTGWAAVAGTTAPLAAHLLTLFADKPALDTRQRALAAWYGALKANVSATIARALRKGAGVA